MQLRQTPHAICRIDRYEIDETEPLEVASRRHASTVGPALTALQAVNLVERVDLRIALARMRVSLAFSASRPRRRLMSAGSTVPK